MRNKPQHESTLSQLPTLQPRHRVVQSRCNYKPTYKTCHFPSHPRLCTTSRSVRCETIVFNSHFDYVCAYTISDKTCNQDHLHIVPVLQSVDNQVGLYFAKTDSCPLVLSRLNTHEHNPTIIHSPTAITYNADPCTKCPCQFCLLPLLLAAQTNPK